jgi:hypothetical protein
MAEKTAIFSLPLFARTQMPAARQKSMRGDMVLLYSMRGRARLGFFSCALAAPPLKEKKRGAAVCTLVHILGGTGIEVARRQIYRKKRCDGMEPKMQINPAELMKMAKMLKTREESPEAQALENLAKTGVTQAQQAQLNAVLADKQKLSQLLDSPQARALMQKLGRM